MKHLSITHLVATLALGSLISACTQAADIYTPPATDTPVVSLTATATRQPETASPTATPTPMPTPTITPLPAPPTSLGPLPEGRIVFTANWEGNAEVMILNMDGSIIQLTSDDLWEELPAWSPDGRWIAYWTRQPDTRIYIVSGDGSNTTPLKQQVSGGYPTWSSDGKQIIFRWDGIYRMNIDGSNQIQIIDDEFLGQFEHDCDHQQYTWSPSGQWLAFTRYCGSGYFQEIDLLDLNTLRTMQFINHAENPAWSPDGHKLAFAMVDTDTGNYDIYTMNIDGTDLTRLTDDPAYDGGPTWSPDGKYIAFVSNRTGTLELYMMNSDGTGQVKLVDGQVVTMSGSGWGPGN